MTEVLPGTKPPLNETHTAIFAFTSEAFTKKTCDVQGLDVTETPVPPRGYRGLT